MCLNICQLKKIGSLTYIYKMYPNCSSSPCTLVRFISKLNNATLKCYQSNPLGCCMTEWATIFIFRDITIIINQFAHYVSVEMLICCSFSCILLANGSSLLKVSCLALIRSDVGIFYTSLLLSNDHWPP